MIRKGRRDTNKRGSGHTRCKALERSVACEEQASDRAEQQERTSFHINARYHLTKRSSATAGGTELSQHRQLFHKIKSAHRAGQRLAAAIGYAFPLNQSVRQDADDDDQIPAHDIL